MHHLLLMHFVITAGRRRVAMRAIKFADARLPDLINRDAAVPESSFKPLPAISIRQSREQTAEPIVIEIHGANLLSSQARQQLGVASAPVLDVVFGMVALGQDEDHPDRKHPSAAQACVQSMISDLPVIDPRDVQLDHQTEQQRNVTYSCVGKLECLAHVSNDTRIISQSPGFVSGKWKLKGTAKFRRRDAPE